jgi:NADPH2:quinone reductase
MPIEEKRLVLTKYGQTRQEAIDSILELQDAPLKRLRSLQSKEVLVVVKSASVSYIDLLMMTGQYHTMLPLPCVPGMEYSGEVLAIGDDVDQSNVRVGDRVLSDFLYTGPRSSGPYQSQGGWQSYAIAPEVGVHRIPKALSFDQACNLLLNYETAYYAFFNRAQLEFGETVLVTGASGAAGLAAVQVAKLLGARVIATGRSDEKLEHVKRFGADHLINTSTLDGEVSVPRFRNQVKEWTNGAGADVLFDTVGGRVSQEGMRSLAFGGRMIIVGWAENVHVARGGGMRGSGNADVLATNIIQMKGLHVMGSPMVIHSEREPDIRIPRLASIFQWVEEGLVRPYESDVVHFTNYKQAMHAKLRGDYVGNPVFHQEQRDDSHTF